MLARRPCDPNLPEARSRLSVMITRIEDRSVSDSGDDVYQGRFRRVQSMYPDVDRDALAAAFLEGAGAFAEANGRDIPGSDDLYLSVRRRNNMGLIPRD